mmetsp:Transcript_7342/g.12290  ORF Transcript_7342/g.12290 Transcript_7342/m.12290 type:complete len:179 (-) Transcript_7342:815-1351(-)
MIANDYLPRMRMKNTESSHYQLPTAAGMLLLSTLFSIQSTSIVAFSHQHHAVLRMGMVSPTFFMKKRTVLHMGLYDDDIDWDADLFGKLSNNKQNNNSSSSNNNSSTNNNTIISEDCDDDGQWDMGQSNKSTMQTMRDKMKRQMGEQRSGGKPEGKPDVGWVPNYGKIIDEDEPWFTG